MTEVEARAALANYLQSSPSDTNHPPPASWAGKSPIAEKVGDGRWVFWYSTAGQPEGGIVISPRDDPYHFCGALGKAIPSLGLPRTPERFLGSTVVGRYGVFENGIAVWEGEPDIGFLVPRDLNEVQQGRQCQAIMAFFDLRGFTSWSSGEDRPAAQIQDIVRVLEEEFQAAFAKGWKWRLPVGTCRVICKSMFNPDHQSSPATSRATGDRLRDHYWRNHTDLSSGTP